jgi:hypothetical protein
MLSYKHILLISIFFTLLSCEPFTGSGTDPEMPPADQLVWVAQVFSGGLQCGGPSYTPPDTRKILHSTSVFVYKTDVEYLPICEACSCPVYAARHFALILRRDVKKAEKIGFEPTAREVDV